jgi:hypothetical protein
LNGIDAGGRALGAIISKIDSLKEFGNKIYGKLYSACVVPILDYCSYDIIVLTPDDQLFVDIS